MNRTKIEWADLTINPVVGCTKCSPACDHCYAERMAARLAKNPKTAAKYAGAIDENGKWTGQLSEKGWVCLDNLPEYPSRRVFLGSMTDIFHENMSGTTFQKLCEYMKFRWPQHIFLLLTKRPQNAKNIIADVSLPENVWLGVTVCNQEEADKKIPVLLEIPAAKRFVSVEPMLGAVDLNKYECLCLAWSKKRPTIGRYLDWVICGGETGPSARPMRPDWVRSLRNQCVETATPFFFKSWGDAPETVRLLGRSCRLLDGQEWNEIPTTEAAA